MPLHTEVDDVASVHVAVVLMHGVAALHEAFAQQRDSLHTRVRLASYDPRSHGKSGWRRHPRPVNAELARLLDEATRGGGRRDQGSRG